MSGKQTSLCIYFISRKIKHLSIYLLVIWIFFCGLLLWVENTFIWLFYESLCSLILCVTLCNSLLTLGVAMKFALTNGTLTHVFSMRVAELWPSASADPMKSWCPGWLETHGVGLNQACGLEPSLAHPNQDQQRHTLSSSAVLYPLWLLILKSSLSWSLLGPDAFSHPLPWFCASTPLTFPSPPAH